MSKKYDYVLGQNKYDCGIASIMTILLYYGIKASREDIISKYKKNDNGYTAYDLIKIGKSYGINGYGIKIDIKHLPSVPVIAHTIKDKNMFHFIVILEKNKNMLKVMDPSIGIINMSYEEFSKITTNIFLVFSGKKSKSKKNQRFKKEIIRIFQNNKRIIFKAILFSIVYVILSLIFNYYLKLMLSYSKNNSILLIILIIFLQISFLKNFVSFLKNNLELNVSKKIDKDITNRVTSHIFNLPYEYFINKTTGELVTIIEDIEYFKEVITKIFISSLVDSILIVLILIYLLFLDPLISLLIFLLILILFIITKNYQYIFNNNYTKLKRSKIDYNSSLIDYISSFQTIKNLFIHKQVTDILENKYSKTIEYDRQYSKAFFKYSLTQNVILDIFYLIIIFISVYLTNISSTSLFNVVLFSSIFYLVIGLSNNINDGISLYKVYETSTERVLDCLEVKEEEFNDTKLSNINEIKFMNISYQIGDLKVLSDINLDIKQGDKVFITGQSGIGKSTLMKLLLRYNTPNEGNIFIDSLNIKDLDLSFIRNSITYISQNEKLFSGSILDNLKMVSNSIENINEASNITLLDEFLIKNGIDYDFLIDEFSNNISGGQKKKLILTRGLLHFKNVLILDEVFNEISLDEERKILKNIFNKYKDKIVIVISHRNNNSDLFNKKYEIKGDGRIYEIK